MLPGPGFSLGDGSVLELDSGGGYATPWMRRMPLRCALTGLFHFDENLKSGRERVMSGKGFMPGEVGSPHGAVPGRCHARHTRSPHFLLPWRGRGSAPG